MFELLPPMKLLTLSILILGWLALGFGIFADQLDPTTFNTVSPAILVSDGDADPDDRKSQSVHDIDAVFHSAPHTGKVVALASSFKRLLNTASTPRHRIISVYRL
jgi:hypothetical protein